MTTISRALSQRIPAVARVALLAFLFASGAHALARATEVSIHEIQSTTTASGASLYKGQEVTISGTVTATTWSGYVVAEAPGAWNAIFVYSWSDRVDVGDGVRLTGTVAEYYGMTQITYVSAFEHLSSGNPVEPTTLAVGEVSQEPYESVLVSVEDVTVVALLGHGEWAVTSDGQDHVRCDDLNDTMYFPGRGDFLDAVTGIVFYSYGNFMIEPRETADIRGEAIPHYALHGHVVTMNDAREVLVSAYVEVLGDRIVTIGRRSPAGVPVVRTGGLIFPGLIDAHNHPRYDVLGPIPFGKLYEHRDEWRSDPIYDDFNAQWGGIRHHGGPYAQQPNLAKLAEIRALTAGTTSIQGANCNGDSNSYFARQGIVVDNVERFPARVYHNTFPLSVSPEEWAELAASNYDRFLVHLAEGTNAQALDEFYTWKDAGLLDWRTTIIHGVPLGTAEWDAMAAAGANLVWSPASNLMLYGRTADIPGALAAGVNVALAPDWTESGSEHLLDELRLADEYDDACWGDRLDARQLVELVTRNAARAVGSEDMIGQVAPGYRANLMVVPGSPLRPYDALLRADPARVKLTVVSGKPMYGNPEVMASFGFLDGTETIRVGDEDKTLAVQVVAPDIPEAGKPCAEILAELLTAYDAVYPKLCEFIGLE